MYGFVVLGLGFGVWGFGWGLGFGVWGLSCFCLAVLLLFFGVWYFCTRVLCTDLKSNSSFE